MDTFVDFYNQKRVQEEGAKLNALKALGLAGAMALSSGATTKSDNFRFNIPSTTQSTKQQTSAVTPEMMKNQLINHEGLKNRAYRDTKGKLTIGIGFNLDDKSNRQLLYRTLGISPNEITPSLKLSDQQIDQLYKVSFEKALADVKRFLPSFDSQPTNVKKALIDMSFNLGLTKLNQFASLKKALEKGDYKVAAEEMMDSLWAKQTGRRARNLSSLVRSSS